MRQLMVFAVVVLVASQAHARVVVHGHRGARARLPENTLPAFAYALEAGVDYLELDLGVTRDGVLVVSHDPHVNPAICRGPKGAVIAAPGPLIHSLTLKELKGYDCGSIRHERFPEQKPVPGTRMPTLEEVFALVRASRHSNAQKVRFNIETKIFIDHPEYTVDPLEFSAKVVAAFRKSGLLARIVLQSFDARTLVAAHALEPRLQLSMLIEDPKLDALAVSKAAHAGIVSPEQALVTKESVASWHAAGLQVMPWTANLPAEWKRLVDAGVDGIITDDPAALIAYLKPHIAE
jgi:glycerophosphoryl diester phosphodiesterase